MWMLCIENELSMAGLTKSRTINVWQCSVSKTAYAMSVTVSTVRPSGFRVFRRVFWFSHAEAARAPKTQRCRAWVRLRRVLFQSMLVEYGRHPGIRPRPAAQAVSHHDARGYQGPKVTLLSVYTYRNSHPNQIHRWITRGCRRCSFFLTV